jgi:hypothetical protein
MDRLTKSIGLVLIASSLGLHGCSNEPNDENLRNDPQGRSTGSGSHVYGSHHGGYGGGYYGGYHGGGWLGALFGHAGPSARGGFGGSAHGGGS